MASWKTRWPRGRREGSVEDEKAADAREGRESFGGVVQRLGRSLGQPQPPSVASIRGGRWPLPKKVALPLSTRRARLARHRKPAYRAPGATRWRLTLNIEMSTSLRLEGQDLNVKRRRNLASGTRSCSICPQ